MPQTTSKPFLSGQPPMKRRRGRPRPAPPRRKTSFKDLPIEVLSVIALFLLPTPVTLEHGFPHPASTPYPPPARIEAGAGFPRRYGSVPRGVIDVVHFARCCRMTMSAAGRMMAGFGGSRPAESMTRTKVEIKDGVEGEQGPSSTTTESGAASVEPTKPVLDAIQTLASVQLKVEAAALQHAGWNTAAKNGPSGFEDVPKQTLYIQVEHCDPEANNIRELILSHRESLEQLVFYKCSHGPEPNDRRVYRNASDFPLAAAAPLQDDEAEVAILPNLRHLQIGPKLCLECAESAVHLICSNSFSKLTRPWWLEAYDSEAGELEGKTPFYNALDFWSPAYTKVSFKSTAAPNLEVLQVHLPPPTRSSRRSGDGPALPSLTRHMAPQVCDRIKMLTVWLHGQDKLWRGFGQNGGSSSVRLKKVEEVEAELQEEADKVMNPKGLKRKRREEEEKAKARLCKYTEMAKAALASKLPTGTTAIAMRPAFAVQFDARGNVIIEMKRSDLIPDAEVDIKPNLADRETKVVGAEGGENSEGDSARHDHDNPQRDYDSNDDDDPGRFSDTEVHQGNDGETHADNGDEGATAPLPSPAASNIPPSGSNASVSVSPSQCQAQLFGANFRKRAQLDILALLVHIANSFPHLVGLSVLRDGARSDIVEDSCDLEVYTRAYVQPLMDLPLKWLDLGLAVVGRKEVSDFPLGLDLLEKAEWKRKRKLQGEGEAEVAAKWIAWRKKAEVAITEGDEWRNKVLRRFVLGKGEDGDGDEDYPHWPVSLEGGHVYTVDLVDRGKRRGVLVPWTRAGLLLQEERRAGETDEGELGGFEGKEKIML